MSDGDEKVVADRRTPVLSKPPKIEVPANRKHAVNVRVNGK